MNEASISLLHAHKKGVNKGSLAPEKEKNRNLLTIDILVWMPRYFYCFLIKTAV